MRAKYFLIICVFYCTSIFSQIAPANCKAKDTVEQSTILPNAEFQHTSLLKYAKVNPVFVVKYSGFTAEAKAAFEHALSIWASLISTPVQIHIDAFWYDGAPGVLGSCVPAEYKTASIGNPERLPNANTYYSIVLAEKMAGKDLNSTNAPDLIVNMSKNINWYLGIDGNCPTDKYDFVTVVVHEICHGLAINGSIKIENSLGLWGGKGFQDNLIPMAYDRFVVNDKNEYLIDTTKFSNSSAKLASEIISDKLFFNSSIAKKYNGNNPIKLFAPSEYDPGGSILHLDETTFPAGNPNSLMTTYLSKGEANHDPGPIVMGMMAEMGWIHTYITPDELKDREAVDQNIEVSCAFFADSGFDASTIRLVYSTNGFSTKQVLSMNKSGDKYTASIPAPNVVSDISYFFSVVDSFDRIYYMPVDSSKAPYGIHCGPDVIDPVITHDSISFMYSDVTSLSIKASVTDNLGIDSVMLEYLINETSKTPIKFVYDSATTLYTAIVPIGVGDVVIGDSIRYRIVAVDKAALSNTINKPTTGYFRINVEKRPPVVITYKNNFDTLTNDFILNGFTMDKVTGFDNAALNSPHPYTGTGKPQVYKQFIAQMKVPVLIQPSLSFIAFDEVVLVEPNIDGKVFGEFGFYDYVIVEGSKDEANWYAFEQTGYNSRYNKDWYSTFNSSLDKNTNSLAVGSASLYRKHQINLRNNKVFRAGDTIYIRFRLHSDAFITGWGWTIDNLVIQDSAYLSLPGQMLASVRLYPNPSEGIFSISGLAASDSKYNLTILSATGQVVYSSEITDVENPSLDISYCSPGMYLVLITDLATNQRQYVKLMKQ